VRLWAAADYFDLGIGLDPPERDSLQEMQAAVRARLGSERFEQLLAEGRRIAEANPQAVVAFALEASTITAPTPPEPSAGRWPFELTARQVEVLRLVAQGLSDAQVAEELVLSQRTVGNHLTAIFQKL